MQKKTVLIVDDSAAIAKRIKRLLDDFAAIGPIALAESYAEALNAIKKYPPDIAILDIHLPDGSGINLIQHIKEHNMRAYIIMATNQADAYYKELCLKTGADLFVDKSNEFDLIPEMIASIL